MTPHAILADLWAGLGLDPAAPSRATLTGDDPILPSSFRLGAVATATIAATALAASGIHGRRDRSGGGRAPTIAVDATHAVTEFASERHLRVEGAAPGDLFDPIMGAYRTRDGGHLRIHTNFPHHRAGLLRLLGDPPAERDAVARAIAARDAAELDDAAAGAGLPAARMRRFAEWDAHPQSAAVASLPLVRLTRIGDARPEPLPPAADRPLAGLRILDLTRIVAGPVAGRTLAAHGAEVMLVTAPHLPSIPPLVVDTGRGKLSASLDLREEAGREGLRALLRGADIILRAYRPGALDARGFSAEAMAALRPGLVVATLSAYGPDGPWAGRRGFDSLVQTATGLNAAEAAAAGTPGEPRPFPVQALDHATGYLMAFGALAALLRRDREGGSWHVEVSLARTALWLRGLGRIGGAFGVAPPDPRPFLEESESGFGCLTAVRHAARLDGVPSGWTRPSVPPGTHPAAWPRT